MKTTLPALLLMLAAVYGCGRPAQAQQRSHRMTVIIIADRSDSVTLEDREFYLRWLARNIYPMLRPGDFAAFGQFGADALGNFEMLVEMPFSDASYQTPSIFSVGDDPVTLQNGCLDAVDAFEKVELPKFEQTLRQQLMKRPTDQNSCLIDTFNVVASRFTGQRGTSVLVVLSDGLEACGGINFENRPPTRDLLETLTRSRRIPPLQGVQVYFVTKIDQREAKRLGNSTIWIRRLTEFWRSFFRVAGASLVRIGPDPTFTKRPKLTNDSLSKSRCGV